MKNQIKILIFILNEIISKINKSNEEIEKIKSLFKERSLNYKRNKIKEY